ncbi:MAG: exodeoxyribonuclease III [Ruminococcaceae bacterium]|nr:exodeoxyribonuclease III [Oscillospiraceae bacterium]
MRFVSWNVNGIRACMEKGFLDIFQTLNADFFCLQETKAQPEQIQLSLDGYEQFWNSAEKKGYSGTAIFAKLPPLSVHYGVGVEDLDHEGRLITLEYPQFYLLTCYTPNAQDGLRRIDHRMAWEDAFRTYVCNLDKNKPVIICGDLNVAHNEIDLKNPRANRGNAGFSDEERGKFNELLSCGLTDTFRYRNPDLAHAYTWWSYRFNARANNAGWRIDYFLVSDRLRDKITATPIYNEIFGSDHCPVGLELSMED